VFSGPPSAADVCAELQRAVARATGPPKYFITDRGVQFQDEYRRWCAAAGVKPRFGAIGKHGSIAVVERLIRTLKSEVLRRFVLPLRHEVMLAELELAARWYNEHRPHARHRGATPAEIKDGATPTKDGPRFEPRRRFVGERRRKLRGRRGAKLTLVVQGLEGRRHLPVIGLKQAA
jgi:hypothetical protein